MLELIAKIMLLTGIGGLVGLFAYHQFKVEKLKFSPLLVIKEVGLALVKAFRAAVRAILKFLNRLRQVSVSVYTFLQPILVKISRQLQGRSRQTTQAFSARFQALVKRVQGNIVGIRGLLKSKAKQVQISRLKRPKSAALSQEYEELLRQSELNEKDKGQETGQPLTTAAARRAELESLDHLLAARRQELEKQRQTRPTKQEREEAQRRQEILRLRERSLLEQVSKRPKDIALYKKLGFLYQELDRQDEARQAFEAALRLGSQDSQIKEQLKQYNS